MQKRKAPVLLFGLVIFAIAGMAIWNATTKPAGAPGAPVSDNSEDAKTTEVSEQDRASAAKDLRESLPTVDKGTQQGGGKHAVMPETPGGSMALATEPTILLPKYSRYSPKPNDSSPSTHWYDDESRAAKIAGDNQKS